MVTSNEFVFFDVDGTLVDGFIQEAFIKNLVKQRLMRLVDFLILITGMALYKTGLLNDPKVLFELALRSARGRSPSELAAIVNAFVPQYLSTHLRRECADIIVEHQRSGRHLVLLSTAIEPILRSIGDILNINDVIGTRMEMQNGHYTGHIEGAIMYADVKLAAAEQHMRAAGVGDPAVWVYADHLSDRKLLAAATHPFAVNPSPALRRLALRRNWSILTFKPS